MTTTMPKTQMALLLGENIGHARRRYEDRTRMLREAGLPAEPTVVLVIDCRDEAGEAVAKVFMDEAYFHRWRATAGREGVPVVTLGDSVSNVVALVRQFNPEAIDGIRRPASPGMFKTAVIAFNRVLVIDVPIEGEKMDSPPFPLSRRLTSFLSPQADHSTSA